MKKMIKIAGLIAVIIIVAMIMSACHAGQLYSQLVFNTEEGGGARLFTVEILHTDTLTGEYNDEGEPTKVERNDEFFPAGYAAFGARFVEKVAEAGWEGTYDDQSDRLVLTMLLTWTDFDEYVEMIQGMIGEERLAESTNDDGDIIPAIADPTLEITANDDGSFSGVYTEDFRISRYMNFWIMEVMHGEDDVFDAFPEEHRGEEDGQLDEPVGYDTFILHTNVYTVMGVEIENGDFDEKEDGYILTFEFTDYTPSNEFAPAETEPVTEEDTEPVTEEDTEPVTVPDDDDDDGNLLIPILIGAGIVIVIAAVVVVVVLKKKK